MENLKLGNLKIFEKLKMFLKVYIIFNILKQLTNMGSIFTSVFISFASVFQPNDSQTSWGPGPTSNVSAESIHGRSQDTYIRLPTLCCHSECTPDDVLIMTLSLVCRHRLTWTAMVDILKMINAIYGQKKKTKQASIVS